MEEKCERATQQRKSSAGYKSATETYPRTLPRLVRHTNDRHHTVRLTPYCGGGEKDIFKECVKTRRAWGNAALALSISRTTFRANTAASTPKNTHLCRFAVFTPFVPCRRQRMSALRRNDQKSRKGPGRIKIFGPAEHSNEPSTPGLQ